MPSLEEVIKSNKFLSKRAWINISASKKLDWNLVVKYPNAEWNWYILNGRKDKPLGFRRNNRHLPWPRYGYPRAMYGYCSDFNTSEEEEYDIECQRDAIRLRRRLFRQIPSAGPVCLL